MIGDIVLTAQQTGLTSVTKVGDRLYDIAGVIIDIDAMAKAVGQPNAGETQQEHASVILMALCLPDPPVDINVL